MIRQMYAMAAGLFLCAAIQSCTSLQCGADKDQFIKQFERFISEVESADLTVTDRKWTIYDRNFETYMLDCYVGFKEDLSFSERQKIVYQAVQYYYFRYKSDMIRALENEENQVSVLIRDEIGQIWDEPEALFRELTGEDWDKLIDEFIRDLDKWENRIRNIFDNEESE